MTMSEARREEFAVVGFQYQEWLDSTTPRHEKIAAGMYRQFMRYCDEMEKERGENRAEMLEAFEEGRQAYRDANEVTAEDLAEWMNA